MSELLDAFNELGQPDHEREGRFFGFVLGKVTDIQDDLVRIKAKFAAQGDSESSDWMAAALPGSIEATPNVGDVVIVGFIDGDPNRPFWTWTITSNTKNRPTEAAVLGTTLAGMLNNLVTQFNQLRTDFNSHTHLVTGAGTACAAPASPWTGTATSAPPTAPTTATAAQKAKAADGSVVGDKATSEIALSGKVKLR